MSVFEATMLFCFGASWPFSIFKSYRARKNTGKSIVFLFLISIGYISGALHKAFYSYDTVIFLYILNGVMVTIDIVLYFRNRRLCGHN